MAQALPEAGHCVHQHLKEEFGKQHLRKGKVKPKSVRCEVVKETGVAGGKAVSKVIKSCSLSGI